MTQSERQGYLPDVPGLTIDLPPCEERTEFNLRRWDELLSDPELARIEGRIETDRYGRIIMSPPPAPSHGGLQSRIAYLLQLHLPEGHTFSECPISTADGVKAADVAWASPARIRELGNRACFPTAPEICVEVLSPGNTKTEIDEKKALFFEAVAREVWLCDLKGTMRFYCAANKLKTSAICPQLPRSIDWRKPARR